jgi:hypothetical protein
LNAGRALLGRFNEHFSEKSLSSRHPLTLIAMNELLMLSIIENEKL